MARSYYSALFISALIIFSVNCNIHSKSIPLTPESGTVLTLQLQDRTSSYYLLNANSPSFIAVSGPGVITVFVRLTFAPSDGTADVPYVVKVSEGDTLIKSVASKTSASAARWLNTSGVPGKSRKFTIRVPQGAHRYKLSLTSPSHNSAGLRYIFEAKSTHGGEVDVYPRSMLGSTSVAFKEKLIDFFLADSARPVIVRLVGPTRLRVVGRLAYNGVMKGPQKYSLTLSLDNHAVPRAALQTTKSATALFTNHKEWSVGESRTIYVDIPGGSHEVAVALGSSPAPAVALRFTIPKEDIANESH